MRAAHVLVLCFPVFGFSQGCGPASDSSITESRIVTRISNAPVRTVKITVTATLDGKPATNSTDLVSISEPFGSRFPISTTGHLILSAVALDRDGCTQGISQAAVDLPNPFAEITLPLTPQSPRSCGALGACAAGTLCKFTPAPTGQTLRAVWIVAPSDVWAAGDGGTVIHYDGSAWTSVDSGTPNNLLAIWASGANNVWIGGQKATLLHYTGSSTPTPVGVTGAQPLDEYHGIWGLGLTDIWLAGYDDARGAGWWYKDGLNTWTKMDVLSTTSTLTGLWASSASNVYACGQQGSVIHYNGTTSAVSSLSSNSLTAIWGSAPNQIYTMGNNSTLFQYGTGWADKSPTAKTTNYNSVFGNETGTFIVGAAGTFLQKGSSASNFSANTSGTSTTLYGVQVGGNGIGWVVGAGGYLAHFDTRP